MEFGEEYALAVKTGAYWMDESYPGWAQKIKLNYFKMDQCEHCIVGQAIGDYHTAIAAATGTKPMSRSGSEWAVEHGFDVPMRDFDLEQEYAAYQHLESLWTDQIRDRV